MVRMGIAMACVGQCAVYTWECQPCSVVRKKADPPNGRLVWINIVVGAGNDARALSFEVGGRG